MNDQRAESVRAARSLFQERGGGSTPTSALQLRIEFIDFKDARSMNRLWHSRLPRIGNPAAVMNLYPHFGAGFDGRWYAVAIWSNPVARLLPQREWLELRRMAIAPDAPKNTASRMLAVMTRLIRQNRPNVVRLVSYQDTEVHTGCIYKAAGWKPATGISIRSRSWNNKTRRRNDQAISPRIRWELSV